MIRQQGDFFVADTARITGNIEVGEGSSFWYGVAVRADTGPIRIGKFTNIQDNCTLHVDTGDSLSIGDYVTIGHGAIIHCRKIENYCLIGMGAILLSGVVIGEGSLVGAGAVVREGTTIPQNSIVVGVPARIIGQTNSDAVKNHRERAILYYELAKGYVTGRHK